MRIKRSLLVAAVLFALTQPTAEMADKSQEFSLDELLVTALRIESKDLETPAYVNVYSQEQLKNTGATNVLDAVRFTEGITYYSLGVGGQSFGSMTSQAVIRGVNSGTLVLVDGVKMNMNGYYNLENISLENVEKVEILKGASSVLYGSEAFGGVINIITKKNAQSSVTVEGGSFGQWNNSLSVRTGNFGITAVDREMGVVKRMSSSGYGMDASSTRSFQWDYKFNEKLSLIHGHSENVYAFDRYNQGKSANDFNGWSTRDQTSQYDETQDYLRLRYAGDKWKVNLYSNLEDRPYEKYTNLDKSKPTHANSEHYKFAAYGLDAQMTWDTPFAKFLGGFGVDREAMYKTVALPSASRMAEARNSYSLFLQGTKDIGNQTTLILGARGEMVDTGNDQIYAFCPQFQVLKKLSNTRSWYANIGKSFKMPTLNQLYNTSGTLAGSNPDLKPEEGWNYETGLKWEGGDSTFKVAVYRMSYYSITYILPKGGSQYFPQNVLFQNVGVELGYQKHVSDAFSYTLGASYSNPQQLNSTTGAWELQYGRMQFTSTLQYRMDRWTTSMSASYFTDRAYQREPQFPVSLTVAYKADKNGTIRLVVDNLLDRRDINSHTTTDYYALPRNYRLGYTRNF